jgi:NAD(P)-dependent dehydrogenase (short-subunit alcohol dehydrogenase family)
MSVPLQRDRYPADLVGTIILFAPDDSDFMTGQVIGVDGGINGAENPPVLGHVHYGCKRAA